MLYIKHVSQQFNDLKILHQLYEEAFPDDEKAPFTYLLKQSRLDNVQFLAFYDQQQFCGFTYLITNHTTVYIFYLAVLKELRHNGYGGVMLEMIKSMYPHHSLFLDIEIIDENANNIIQRKKRRDFYLKHGFISSSYEYHFYHIDYEILKYGNHFCIQDCHNLFYQFSNGNVDVKFKKLRY